MSLGQLCIILLVDLIVAPVQLPAETVPSLLQVVLVLWDHHTEVVQEQAHEMLIHLIHELVVSRLSDTELTEKLPMVEELIELIRRRDQKVVWTYEETYGHDRKSQSEPISMVYVVSQVLALLSLTHPGIPEAWGSTALTWATHCPIQHLACRSLQMYRCIQEPLDQRTLSDMLARLSVTIADEGSDIQAYSMELIRTLHNVVERVCTDLTGQIPTLFWTICGCLDSVHELEYTEALSMLEGFMDKVDLRQASMQTVLLEAKPRNFEWNSEGLTGLIYKGCRSGQRLDDSLRVIDRLLKIPSSALIGDESRLLYALLVNLPRLLHALQDSFTRASLTEACQTIGKAASSQGLDVIATLMRGYEGHVFTTSLHFLSSAVSALKAAYFPGHGMQVLMTYMGLLSNNISWFKIAILEILKCLIPHIDLRKPDIAIRGPNLVSPLLTLLQTEYSALALEVLDGILSVTGAMAEKQYARAGMSSGSSTRSVRETADDARSLYGVPEESGWSIPMPELRKAVVRSNIYDVFTTFADLPARDTTSPRPAGVEFCKEEYHHTSYLPDRTATMTSDEATLADTNMGELVTKLDSLDDFFDSVGPERNDNSSSFSFPQSFTSTPSTSTRDNSFISTPSTSLSDNPFDARRAPRQAVSRNASINSLRSFENPRPVPPRDRVVMSPSAFTVSPKRPSRPGMHQRSVTSPPGAQRALPERSFTVSSDDTEPFSDDDLAAGRTSTSDASFVVQDALRNQQRNRIGFRSGMRSGLKRFYTGGGGAGAAGTGAVGDRRGAGLKLHVEHGIAQLTKTQAAIAVNPKSAEL